MSHWFDAQTIAYDIVALFVLAVWAVVAGVVTWLLMGWDKWRAGRARRRIRESTLLGWAWLGGGLGLALGMTTFRHKTRHMRFRVVAALSAILWSVPLVVAAVFLIWEGSGR